MPFGRPARWRAPGVRPDSGFILLIVAPIFLLTMLALRSEGSSAVFERASDGNADGARLTRPRTSEGGDGHSLQEIGADQLPTLSILLQNHFNLEEIAWLIER
jgi:hypothetical protein